MSRGKRLYKLLRLEESTPTYNKREVVSLPLEMGRAKALGTLRNHDGNANISLPSLYYFAIIPIAHFTVVCLVIWPWLKARLGLTLF